MVVTGVACERPPLLEKGIKMAKTYLTITVDSEWAFDALELADDIPWEEANRIVARMDEHADEFRGFIETSRHRSNLLDDVYDSLHSLLRDFIKEKAGDLLDNRL